MVKITKEQAKYVMQHINEVKEEARSNPFVRTMKQKSKRHSYYACNDDSIMKLINDYNTQIKITETYGNI